MRHIHLFILLTIQFTVLAQDIPRLSPSATVEQKIGITWVTVSYSRPSVKERKIWDSLVPMQEIWRTGANEPTILIFDQNVLIQGKEIEAGQYALFSNPGKEKFRIHLNSNSAQWGSFDFDSTFDAIAIDVPTERVDFTEHLTFGFDEFDSTSAKLCMRWDTLRICIRISVDLQASVLSEILTAIGLADSTDYTAYIRAINYAVETGFFHTEARAWVREVLEISHRSTEALWASANLMSTRGDYDTAISYAKEAVKQIDQSNYQKEFQAAIKENIKRWEEIK